MNLHAVNLVCLLCQKEIIQSKEKYKCIEDFEFGKKTKETWCHKTCFDNAVNTNIQKVLKQAGNILNRIIPQQRGYPKEYELK